MFRPEYRQQMQQQIIPRDTVLQELIRDRIIKLHGVITTAPVEDQILKLVDAVTLEIKRLSELCPKQPLGQPPQFIQQPVMQYPFGQYGFTTPHSFGVNSGFSKQPTTTIIEIDKVAHFLQNSNCQHQARYVEHAISVLREIAKNEKITNLENNSNLIISLAFVIRFTEMFNEIKSRKGIYSYDENYSTMNSFKRRTIINNIEEGIHTDSPLALSCAAIAIVKHGHDKVSSLFFGKVDSNKMYEMIRCISHLMDDSRRIGKESSADYLFTKELDTLLKYIDIYKYVPSEKVVKDSEWSISQIVAHEDFGFIDKNKLSKAMMFMCELYDLLLTKSNDNKVYTYSERLVIGVTAIGLHLDGYEVVSKLGNIDTNNMFTSIHSTMSCVSKYFKAFAENNIPPAEEQMKSEPSPSSESKKEEKVEEEEKEVRIDIYGLDPAEVLVRLWTAAKTEERHGNRAQELSIEDARKYLERCNRKLNGGQIYADYVEGKRIKIHMDNSIINTTVFDKEYGEGLASEVIDGLRKEKGIYVFYKHIVGQSREREDGSEDEICTIYTAEIVDNDKYSNSNVIINDPSRYKIIHRKGGFSFFLDIPGRYNLAWSMNHFIKKHCKDILKYNSPKEISYNHSSIDVTTAISTTTLEKVMNEIADYEESM